MKVWRELVWRLLDLYRPEEDILQGQPLELFRRVPGLGLDAVVAAAAASAAIAAVIDAALPLTVKISWKNFESLISRTLTEFIILARNRVANNKESL